MILNINVFLKEYASYKFVHNITFKNNKFKLNHRGCLLLLN